MQEENSNNQNTRTYPYEVSVLFKDGEKPYTFGTKMPDLKKGDKVVVETKRGLEIAVCNNDAHPLTKVGAQLPLKPVLRIADAQDISDDEENEELNQDAFEICAEEIKHQGLQMNLISARYSLDRRKVMFVYVAEHRVDFRGLLKKLSEKLGCRIELLQIGERDKVKMVGGMGLCGMECCSSRVKIHFDTIRINMAKNQLLALNMEKLSGQCGRLMCCLKYEDDDYKELTSKLPKMGSQIEYNGTIYRLTSMNVMSNQAKLENRLGAEYITIDELKEKGIVRKGVQQPRSNPAEAQGNKGPQNSRNNHSRKNQPKKNLQPQKESDNK